MRISLSLILACTVFVSILPSGASAAESQPEEDFYQGNSTGSAGWDMHAADEDEPEEPTEAELARRKAHAEREKAAREAEEERNNFFSSSVEGVDKSVSKVKRGKEDE